MPPWTDGIRKRNDIQVDNGKDLDAATPIYNLKEYRNNCEKTSGNLYKHHKNDFNDNMAEGESFKFKWGWTNNTNIGCIANVEIASSLKNLMPLIGFEINLRLTWSGKLIHLRIT